MSLTRTQKKALLDFLCAHYDEFGFDRLLYFIGNGHQFINKNQPHTANVLSVVRHAEADGWFQALLDEVSEDRKGMEAWEALVETHFKSVTPRESRAKAPSSQPTGESTAKEPYFCVTMGNRIFINRDALRLATKEIQQGDKRVLAVDGDPDSGRKYSIVYLSHVLGKQGTQTAFIGVKDEFLEADHCEIAHTILLHLGHGDGLPEDLMDIDAGKAVRKQSAFLFSKCVQFPAEMALIIDCVDAANLTPYGRELLLAFSTKVAMGKSKIKLILIGIDLVRPLSEYACVELIRAIQPKDVENFFRLYARERALSWPREVITHMTDRVFDSLPVANVPARVIAERVCDILEAMQAPVSNDA